MEQSKEPLKLEFSLVDDVFDFISDNVPGPLYRKFFSKPPFRALKEFCQRSDVLQEHQMIAIKQFLKGVVMSLRQSHFFEVHPDDDNRKMELALIDLLEGFEAEAVVVPHIPEPLPTLQETIGTVLNYEGEAMPSDVESGIAEATALSISGASRSSVIQALPRVIFADTERVSDVIQAIMYRSGRK